MKKTNMVGGGESTDQKYIDLAGAIVGGAVEDMLWKLDKMYHSGKIDNSWGKKPKNGKNPSWKQRGLRYYKHLFASEWFSDLTMHQNESLFSQTIEIYNKKIIQKAAGKKYKIRTKEWFEDSGLIPSGYPINVRLYEIEDGKVIFKDKTVYRCKDGQI